MSAHLWSAPQRLGAQATRGLQRQRVEFETNLGNKGVKCHETQPTPPPWRAWPAEDGCDDVETQDGVGGAHQEADHAEEKRE